LSLNGYYTEKLEAEKPLEWQEPMTDSSGAMYEGQINVI